ncbi:MAG: transporter substrate-binding domain-containing protein, partial [Proteobacteria bacterium]|nr:transporter substrate-binding domain-containing protein [Pseudomonadota bacterium]
MKIWLLSLLFVTSILTSICNAEVGVVNTEASVKEKLTIVTKPFIPFIIPEKNGEFKGFSIDLWKLIAEKLNVDYEIKSVDTIKKLLDEIQDGKANVGLAGISMTAEREKRLDFSYPFFNSGLQIMVSTDSKGSAATVVIDMLLSFLKPKMLLAIGILFITLFIVGNIIWLAERKRNPDEFSAQYLKGVMDGLWWAAVTLTTVGYGDKSPRGFVGRFIGLLWMFIGLFFIASFTATVTSTLTLQQLKGSINGPADLAGKKVATISGSTADTYLTNKSSAIIYRMKELKNAFFALEKGQIDAIVYDSPVLRYHEANSGGIFKIVGPIFQKENYALVFPTDSKIKEKVNLILLELG